VSGCDRIQKCLTTKSLMTVWPISVYKDGRFLMDTNIQG